jgi:hypothetical protein
MAETASLRLFSKQIQAYQFLEDDTTNELCYGGAARGGKSWLGCGWQIIRRIKFAGSAGLIAREELVKLKDTTLLTFFKVLNEMKLRDVVDYNAQSMTATFPNGSVIFFREIKYIPSDPEFDRLGSYDLTDCFLDEAQQISSKAISVLKGRFSLLYGPGWATIPKALYTCNPTKGWIYTDFVQPDKIGDIRSDRQFIKALPKDNPHVPQSYLDNLLKADKVTIERLYYGNFEYDDDPSVLCEYDAILDMFTNDHVKPTGNKYISADLAMQGRDKFVAGVWDGLVVRIPIDQGKSTGKSIETDLRKLMETNSVPRSRTVADSDGMGNYLESYLEGIKEFHGGAQAINKAEFANIKAECAYKLADMINERKIKVICTDLQKKSIIEEIGMLKADSVDKDESKKRIIKKELMKEALRRSPDYLDMLIMGMYFHVARKPAEVHIIRRT